MKPTIGRIVWTHNGHIDAEGVIRPGMIVEVQSETVVGVKIVTPTGDHYESHMEQSEGLKETLCWDWMPYQKQEGQKEVQAERAKMDAAPASNRSGDSPASKHK